MDINVNLDQKLFKDFVYFENFYHKKIWILPTIFIGISLSIAFICFLISATRNLSYLLTYLFIIIGIILPTVYFYSYWLSLKNQLKIFQLKKYINAYSLNFSDNSVEVYEGNNKSTYNLDTIYKIFEYKDSIYLYVAINKAYILPVKQMDIELYNFLKNLMK